MSIISAIKEAQHDENNLEDLAKLPQYLIMNMIQRGEIKEYMLTPILGKKAEMAEDEARMNAAKQLAEQGGAMPTVVEKYMGQIAQAENPAPPMPQQQMQQPMPQQMAAAPMPQGPEDVGIATQATQPMGLAGGGIIAFSPGGDVDTEDDDYQEAMDDARESAMNDKLYEMISGLKGSDAGENRGVGITAGHRGAERGMEDKGDLESRLRAIIMKKESGGKRYDKAGNLLTSSKGALGEMQVMPETARSPGFGIKPAKDVNDPNELSRVGSEYVGALLNKYQDPKLTMIAYNMGPGATDKWLASGADPRKLPKETQGYIRGVNLAQGGEVKHYAAGGYEDDTQYDPVSGLPTYGFETYRERPAEREAPSNFFMDQPWQRKAAKETNKKIATTKPSRGKASPEEVEQFFSRYDNIPVKGDASQIPQNAAGIVNLKQDKEDKEFNMMDYIKSREAKMDAAEKKDLALAGLAAGLGMLGGTSQYAFENIGKGGQMGVQQLAASQKNRMAQEAALGKLYGSAAQTDLMNKLRRDQLAQTGELAKERMDQALLTAKNNFIQKRMKEHGMDEMMIGNLKRQQAKGKLDPDKLADLQYYENSMKNIEREANRMFANPRGSSGVIKLD